LTQLKAGEAAERPRVEASAGAKRPRTMIERGAAHRAEPLIDSGGRRQALPQSWLFTVRARSV